MPPDATGPAPARGTGPSSEVVRAYADSSAQIVAPGVADDGRRARLAEFVADLRGWQDLPDPSHIAVILAAAATRDDDGEPCWLLVVAPPSSGKTEGVRLLDETADERLDEITAAGLLGWSRGKTAQRSGVLARVGKSALVTFGDFSTLLSTSDRGGRDEVFALLRRAYDGSVSRDVSPPGRVEGTPRLEWQGRLTVVAASTGAIDRFSAHADALGPRWLYVRLPDRDTAAKRAAARMSRRRAVADRRAEAGKAAEALVRAAARSLPDALPDAVADTIEDAALTTCWGRASVPRSGYGRREILDVAVVEEPMRVVQQLTALARGLFGLGLRDPEVAALTTRVALDSMPAARRAVLAALAAEAGRATSAVARAARIDRKVAKFALEELESVGVVLGLRPYAHLVEDDDKTPVTWSLDGPDGDLVARVFADHGRFGGWDETWEPIPRSPQVRGDAQ